MTIRRALLGVVAVVGMLIAVPNQAHATGTWVWSKPISHTYQDAPQNCVPASFENQLTTVDPTNTYTQDELAQQMGTTSTGTTWPNAATTMNQIVAPSYIYDIRVVASPADVMTEMQYEISAFGAAMVAPTVEGQLPWVDNPSDTAGHAIVVYGYNVTQDAFYTWDPLPGRGYEWITASDLYNALQANNGGSAKAVYEFSEEQ